MNIYSSKPSQQKTNYRNVYEKHFGKIPNDENGRSYEIHHIDGNRDNNDPSNLISLTINEHYDVHYSQGDWKACLAIAMRMKITPEEKQILCSIANSGSNNPSYGKFWWNNGNQEIKSREAPNESWCRGRLKTDKHTRKTSIDGLNNPRADKKLYHFIHADGTEAIMTRFDFRTKFLLDRKGVEKLLNGITLTHKGWRLYTPIREPKPLGRPSSSK